MTKVSKKLEAAIKQAETAQVALDAANAAIRNELQSSPVGTHILLSGIPHTIVEDGKDGKKLKCQVTKFQIALIRGENPPAPTRRSRKSKDEKGSTEEPAAS